MDWTRGRTIGRGSTATVSIATVDQSGHLFAVKSCELSQSESLRKEQSILCTLSCPQVVAYKGCVISSENGKLLYNLFLEYAPSGTVTDAIQKHGGCLEEDMVRSYTRGILLGLEFLHSRRIVHCDIKGQNILVTDDGVKIADLGCARRADGTSGASWSVAGTPVYMAPEVARGEQQGFSADVWALGCTVIEMATGRAPWPDVGDPVSALYRIGYSNDALEIPNMISKQTRDFLSKCLRRDPAERWSATQLLSHDFVKESKEPVGSISETPNNVLHPHFWDSVEELETVQIASNKSLMERIRQLGEDNLVLSSKLPSWEYDENWVTVRNNVNLEVELLPNKLDHNFLHVDESTSRLSEDYEIVVDYYLTKNSGQNSLATNSERDESRHKLTSFAACKYVFYILCMNLNYFNDKCFFNPPFTTLQSLLMNLGSINFFQGNKGNRQGT
ncbi:mitogen-activated protein kinase kinase kinase 18-like [Hibiscus syriacus]|uniref:mitogen-activated protein kinase kinase kinase 18-like n=1 Tax=Hibiscus syriacus TaxID=106335 RepID=UPI0019215B06|nr:mitogen-activated protein kinase kinase kinase 18-like [Hibiscus syriacus]